MTAQTCWAGEAAVVNHSASFDADDLVSAKVVLDSHELCVGGLPRIFGNSATLRPVLEMVLISGETRTGKEPLKCYACPSRQSLYGRQGRRRAEGV
jgi:hypothetical protein